LGGTGDFRYFGEVFHDAPDRDLSFVDWMRQKQKLWVDTFSWEGAESTAEEYFEFLSADAGSASPLIDIKLNSWMTFHPGWYYPGQKPFLMDFLQRRGGVFLFLRRKDLASQILSEFVARQVGKWHSLTDEDASGLRFEVPLDEVRSRAANIIAAEKLVATSLGGTRKALSIWYEDLYQDGQIASNVVSFLNNEFGLSLTNLRPEITKNAGDKSVLVENFAAVASAIHEVERANLRLLQ
jgi:hypothetical protein